MTNSFKEVQALQATELILHNSLLKQKARNSKITNLIADNSNTKKGAIAVFRSKESMSKAHGFIVTSQESLNDNISELTHWTPNTFSWLGYTQDTKKIRGHFEKNLIQINTFVVDVDFPNSQERDKYQKELFDKLTIDNRFLPTILLKTDKGYQAYYVLSTPAFVSRHGEKYPVLEAAKLVANNLKNAIKSDLPQVDVGCNSFGIFRIPNAQNLLYFESQFTYEFQTLVEWSKEYSKNHRPKLQIVKTPKYSNQMKQPWFNWMLKQTQITSGKGLGRHNTILTLALACYSSGYSYSAAYDLLDEFNSNLNDPLDLKDFENVLRDSYSGKYQGAHGDYIKELINTWATAEEQKQLRLSPSTTWYKFAKKREERKYSHKNEWAQDILALVQRLGKGKKQIELSTRMISKELGISPASLNRTLKRLRSSNQLIITERSGNKANLLATLNMVLIALLDDRKAQSQNWINYIAKQIKTTQEQYTGFKEPVYLEESLDLSSINTA